MNRKRLVATGVLFRGGGRTVRVDRTLGRVDDLAKPRKNYTGRHNAARFDGDIFDV